MDPQADTGSAAPRAKQGVVLVHRISFARRTGPANHRAVKLIVLMTGHQHHLADRSPYSSVIAVDDNKIINISINKRYNLLLKKSRLQMFIIFPIS